MRLVMLPLAVAVAALTSTCQAQGERAAWLLEVIGGPVTPQNPSVSVRFSASFPVSDYAFAGAVFDLNAASGSWTSVSLIIFGPGSARGDPGTVWGRGITGILCQQYGGPHFIPNSSNPIAVWEGTWTTSDFGPRSVRLETETRHFGDYVSPQGWLTESRLDVLDEGRAFIRVVPAPGAAALTALALALVPRRRRSAAR